MRAQRRSPVQQGGYPKQQVSPDFLRIKFIQHLVPTSRIEMMGEVRQPCPTIAIHQDSKALQALAHGIVAAGKEVDWQAATYPAKPAGISQLRSGGQEGLH